MYILSITNTTLHVLRFFFFVVNVTFKLLILASNQYEIRIPRYRKYIKKGLGHVKLIFLRLPQANGQKIAVFGAFSSLCNYYYHLLLLYYYNYLVLLLITITTYYY